MTDDEKQRVIETGRALEIMLADPAIQRWFDVEKNALTTAMINAEIGDDDTRRECALGLRALHKLKSAIQNAVSRARHVEQTGDTE